PVQVKALAAAGTVAGHCPGANVPTPGPRPPTEAMRDARLPMAIASDLNPGTSNSESLPYAMSLACVAWGISPLEALRGATLHPARSLGLEGLAGCLRPGSFADCIVLDVETPEAIPYYVGAAVATERIGLRRHLGEHPRMGATDVVPFVPFADLPMSVCVDLARRFGSRLWTELRVPVYYYGEAATRPDRRELERVRRGG